MSILTSNGRPPLRPPVIFKRRDEAIRRPAPPPPVPNNGRGNGNPLKSNAATPKLPNRVSRVAPRESLPREAEARHRCSVCKNTQSGPQPTNWFTVTSWDATGSAEDPVGLFCSEKCLMKFSQRMYQTQQPKSEPKPAALEVRP